MSLLTCSDCGRAVSDRAASCPGCGAPLTNPSGPPSPPNSGHAPAPPFSSAGPPPTRPQGTGFAVAGCVTLPLAALWASLIISMVFKGTSRDLDRLPLVWMAMVGGIPLVVSVILGQVAHMKLRESGATHGFGAVLTTKILGILLLICLIAFFFFVEFARSRPD